MPDPTPRDREVLRALARWQIAPFWALLQFFPTPAAGYVRLGMLARSGMIRKAAHRGDHFVMLTAAGARAIAVPLPRTPMARLPYRLAFIHVDHAMAARGYTPVPPPRGAPRQLWYYANGSVRVATTTCRTRAVTALAHRLVTLLGPQFLAREVNGLFMFTPRLVRANLAGSPWARKVRVIQLSRETQGRSGLGVPVRHAGEEALVGGKNARS